MSSFSPAAPGGGNRRTSQKPLGNACTLRGFSCLRPPGGPGWGKMRKARSSGGESLGDNCELFLPGAFSALDAGGVAGYMKNITLQARSSGGEHYLDTVGVRGSNPGVPTRYFKGLRFRAVAPFLLSGYHLADHSLPTTAGSSQQTSCLPGGFHTRSFSLQDASKDGLRC